MTTAGFPHAKESVHADDLRKLGFYKLDRSGHGSFEEYERAYIETVYRFHRPDHEPFFSWLFGGLEMTYAMDDTGTFWKCDRIIDLAVPPFRFQQQSIGLNDEKASVH